MEAQILHLLLFILAGKMVFIPRPPSAWDWAWYGLLGLEVWHFCGLPPFAGGV